MDWQLAFSICGLLISHNALTKALDKQCCRLGPAMSSNTQQLLLRSTQTCRVSWARTLAGQQLSSSTRTSTRRPCSMLLSC